MESAGFYSGARQRIAESGDSPESESQSFFGSIMSVAFQPLHTSNMNGKSRTYGYFPVFEIDQDHHQRSEYRMVEGSPHF